MIMKRLFIIFSSIAIAVACYAQDSTAVLWKTSLIANASTGKLAPYMVGSWNYGRVNGASGIWADGAISKKMSLGSRFSWGAGAELIAGYGSAADYDRYLGDGQWTAKAVRQSPVRLQQLYAEVKYRGVYILAGMKERHSQIVDDELSSGDLTRSNNAAPIPGVSAGFVDFQNIPFTKGCLQIEGEVTYGRFFDRHYRLATANRYSGVVSYDNYYIYRRCYFRTKPTEPFSVIFGMQAAGEFGGYARAYRRGSVTHSYDRGFRFADVFKMFIPHESSDEGFVLGNSLGSWDIRARYRFSGGSELAAYVEWPWEDGTGIGKQNGWDGLWGLQYDFAKEGPVTAIALEYFDFTNMAGPIHWATGDSPGTDITTEVTGGDNYYNNDFYGPYSYYGMSLGSPFVVSPLYNLDGYPDYAHNRARGVHAALRGTLAPGWRYTAKYSWQQAGGEGRIPAPRRLLDNSASAQISWQPGAVKGLTVNAQMAFDAGRLRGNNFGALIAISYSGTFNLRKK